MGWAQSKAHIICIITCLRQVSQLYKTVTNADCLHGPVVCIGAWFLSGSQQTSKWEVSELLQTDYQHRRLTTATGYKGLNN